MSPPSYGRTPRPERVSYGRSGSGQTLPGTSSGAYAAFARGARNSTTKLTTSDLLDRLQEVASSVQRTPYPPSGDVHAGCVGTLGSQRRIASEAALALGAGPELEQQPKLILPINRDAPRGINLPDGAIYQDGGSCHT